MTLSQSSISNLSQLYELPPKLSISYFMLRLCLPAWCASACPPPSPMGTPSPSRPSTGSTATPSTDLMGLERGVWDQQGLGTTPWSPVLTLSTGATIMQAEPSKILLCFIVNSKL